jgi:hypothetical protein
MSYPALIFKITNLSDHSGKRRKLSELQGEERIVLVLSRGGFCPKAAGSRKDSFISTVRWRLAIAVWGRSATDNITETNENRTGVGAYWPFLSDSARVVQKDLDIAEYTNPLHNPMIPHVIVLKPGLVVYKI